MEQVMFLQDLAALLLRIKLLKTLKDLAQKISGQFMVMLHRNILAAALWARLVVSLRLNPLV
jgi:hypothetical protein